MRTYTPKVGKHVTYLATTTAKPRPATITAVVDSTHVNLRITHSGETHANVVKQSAANQTNVWRVTNAYG